MAPGGSGPVSFGGPGAASFGRPGESLPCAGAATTIGRDRAFHALYRGPGVAAVVGDPRRCVMAKGGSWRLVLSVVAGRATLSPDALLASPHGAWCRIS